MVHYPATVNAALDACGGGGSLEDLTRQLPNWHAGSRDNFTGIAPLYVRALRCFDQLSDHEPPAQGGASLHWLELRERVERQA